MAKLSVRQIRQAAVDLLEAHPGGLRYSELLKMIITSDPETEYNTVTGTLVALINTRPEVVKPSKGLFRLKKFIDAGPEEEEPSVVHPSEAETKATKLKESAIYEPFSKWLKEEMDEASEVLVLGGSFLRSKWGTPDVVGVYKAKRADLIQFLPEIISAEIKIDPREAIVAFGQAVAYRLFSHKSYMVMPSAMPEEDKGRLEALATIFGIGFVLFDVNGTTVEFSIRVRAQKSVPDMFYLNEFAKRLHEMSAADFERLF